VDVGPALAAELLAAAVVVGMTLYALLAGADFGAGIWQALAARSASPAEREQVHAAVGPVWEANHVWLIFVLVILHTAFPPALAALARALWLPLLLALAGIVMRGAGFAFRPREPALRRERRAWEGVFAGASVAAPFFLGCAVGAVAEGRLPVTAAGEFTGHATSWASPFSLFAGLLAVALCAHLAAVYLARESAQWGPSDLAPLWRRRAIATSIVVGGLALAGIAVLALSAPALWRAFAARAPALVALSVAAGLATLLALARRRFTLAAGAAALAVASVLWGGWVAQHPMLVPPALSLQAARAPDAVLSATVVVAVVGAVLTAPALLYLMRVFKTARRGPVPRG
jgi:cytochrome bd ubiquinol oxidase subunit II